MRNTKYREAGRALITNGGLDMNTLQAHYGVGYIEAEEILEALERDGFGITSGKGSLRRVKGVCVATFRRFCASAGRTA
jgi:hypothetical protein